MLRPTDLLSIGDIAARTGLAVSAIRYYEEQGLVLPERNRGNQRRFLRSDIRRISFIRIAQQLGLTIADIKDLLATLPNGRTPTKKDWGRFSRIFQKQLDAKIEGLTLLRKNLDGCIGCGCLSLSHCAIYNPQDTVANGGHGPRNILPATASTQTEA